MAIQTSRPRRLLAAAATGCVALALASQLPASAAPGAGTWTKVTTPANGRTFLSHSGHEGSLTVKGTSSSDVTAVNVYCLRGSGAAVQATTVATAVPVSAGVFQQSVPVPGSVGLPQCRLRALPSGVNPQAAYLSSYAGPIVNFDSWQSSATDFQLTASAGTTAVTASSLGSCSTDNLAPVTADQTVPGGSAGCLLSLSQNASGSRSGMVVDGHQVIPPADAARFGVTPRSTVRSTFHTTKSGGVRWTDTEALDRCATGTAFPPSTACALQATGVEVRQVATLLKSGQVQLRAEFHSVDGKRHRLQLAYTNVISTSADGELGVRFPGQKGFHAPVAGQKVTKSGAGGGSMFARTNRFGDEGDPAVATRALSWSRSPSRIAFAPTNASTFELDYRLTVPKGGSTFLGFTDSIAVRTTGADSLGAKAERDMMPAPVIVGPRSGATIHGTKTAVAGVVYRGANGLPVTASVNGHRVKLKVAKRGTFATLDYTFHESLGKHTISLVTKDSAGNKRSTSVKVTNK